ncbi:MAG: M23 family peptidase [Calditrichaeota bacterium]|nr:MAG: M23 family peptidase [Calditrichota bacterium]
MKIIRYNPEEETFRSYSLDRFKLIVFPIATIGVLLVFALGFSAFYFKYQESNQVKNLKRQTQYLSGLVTHLQNKNLTIQQQINQVRTQAAKLSEFVQLPFLETDKWEIGSGGSEYTLGIEDYIPENELRGQLLKSEQDLDKFSKEISWLYTGLKAVERKLEADKNLRVHFPSIRPVPKGILTSGFGMRNDPFTGEKRHHNGLDFFAKIGTKIYAPADGIIELSRTKYSQNQSFGKLIVINHGSGIKTRYGHLHKVFVKKGERVKRHQIIGEVGNSGRSTGSHLHYEVLKHNKARNPYYFLLD